MTKKEILQAINADGLCTTGALGMTPEEVVAKYPKIALMLLKEQYDIIEALREDVKRLKESRDIIASELYDEAITKDK